MPHTFFVRRKLFLNARIKSVSIIKSSDLVPQGGAVPARVGPQLRGDVQVEVVGQQDAVGEVSGRKVLQVWFPRNRFKNGLAQGLVLVQVHVRSPDGESCRWLPHMGDDFFSRGGGNRMAQTLYPNTPPKMALGEGILYAILWGGLEGGNQIFD